MSYLKVISTLDSKNCKLNWTEEEFKENYKTAKSNINILSSCGHQTTVQYNNILYSNTGVLCKQCVNEKMSKDKINKSSDNNNIEYNFLKGLQQYCDILDVKLTGECCLADLCYKPKNIEEDLWMPLQLKVRTEACHRLYSFHVSDRYKNMFVLLACTSEQKYWILNGNDITVKNISISIKNSIYKIYEKDSVDMLHYLNDLYYTEKYKHFLKPFYEINTPMTAATIQEQEFNRNREEKLTNLKIQYPNKNKQEYDCIINGYKVQDKVITQYYKIKKDGSNRNTASYCVHFCRRRSTTNMAYKLGDNHYYWFHMQDKDSAYIIPEKALYDIEYISDADINQDLKHNACILLYPHYSNTQAIKFKTGFLNKYLYSYNKPELIEQLFTPVKQFQEESYEIFKIKSNLIKVLVQSIIASVLLSNLAL